MGICALIVDDEPDIRELIAMSIRAANEGLSVCGEAAAGAEAIDIVEEKEPGVVVLDERMPGMSGIDTARELLRRRPDQQIVLCSAYLDTELRRTAESIGIRACFSKTEIDRIPVALKAMAAEKADEG